MLKKRTPLLRTNCYNTKIIWSERKMGSLQTAKILGGIGALLMLIGVFVTATLGALTLIGFILVFIAVKMIADETKEKEIKLLKELKAKYPDVE